MSIFESLKRTFNIGGCTIEITPLNEAFHQGERISGTVQLRGGDYLQEATELKISLVEFWTESRGSGKDRRTVTVTAEADSAVMASPCVVTVGAESTYHFDLELPADGRLSTPGESTGWRLNVDLDIPHAIDPSCSLGLHVEPAVALLELASLWSDVLQWREVPNLRTWDRHQRQTCLRFIPPTELQGDFDHLDLSCRPQPSGDWHASLSFDLQEKSLTDRLKAIVDQDKATRDLYIPTAALAGSGEARTAFATTLVHLMKDIVEARP